MYGEVIRNQGLGFQKAHHSPNTPLRLNWDHKVEFLVFCGVSTETLPAIL